VTGTADDRLPMVDSRPQLRPAWTNSKHGTCKRAVRKYYVDMPIELSRRYFLIRSTAALAATCLGREEMIIYSREFLTYMDPANRIPAVQVQNHSVKSTLPLTSLRLKSIISHPAEDAVINLRDNPTLSAALLGRREIDIFRQSFDGWRRHLGRLRPQLAARPLCLEVMGGQLDSAGCRQLSIDVQSGRCGRKSTAIGAFVESWRLSLEGNGSHQR
jgi:hypothetical protein